MVGMLVATLLSPMLCMALTPDTEVVRPQVEEVRLTIEEAQRLIDAWERFEGHLRASREDTSGSLAAQGCCPDNTDLAMIRTCICAIKNQLCVITGLIGSCTDPVIPEVTFASCITQDEISAICASLQSWVKTIVSELRGNQTECPVS